MKRTEILATLSRDLAEETNQIRKMTGYEKEFHQASYRIWAMKEIYNLLKKTPSKDPEFVLGDFRADMDYYALSSKASYIFSVAYDTATYYYDMCFGDGDSWTGQSVID